MTLSGVEEMQSNTHSLCQFKVYSPEQRSIDSVPLKVTVDDRGKLIFLLCALVTLDFLHTCRVGSFLEGPEENRLLHCVHRQGALT